MKRFSIPLVVVLLSLLVSSQASAQSMQYSFLPDHPVPTDIASACMDSFGWIGNSLVTSENGQITQLSIYYPGATLGTIAGKFSIFEVTWSSELGIWEMVSLIHETGTINVTSIDGWHSFTLETPIQISPGHTYMVGFYSSDPSFRSCYLDLLSYNVYNNLLAAGSIINLASDNNGGGYYFQEPYWGPETGTSIHMAVDIVFEPISSPSGEDGAFNVNLDFDAIFTNASDFANGMFPVLAIAVGLQLGMVVLVMIMRRIKSAIDLRR